VRFENRVLDEWLEDRVLTYFLCGRAAKDVVPVSSGRNYIDVVVKWTDGDRWLMRCFPHFERKDDNPPIGGMIDTSRSAMLLKARPCIGYVSDDRVEVVWCREPADLRLKTPLEKAA
jgi:hypothetical protein